MIKMEGIPLGGWSREAVSSHQRPKPNTSPASPGCSEALRPEDSRQLRPFGAVVAPKNSCATA